MDSSATTGLPLCRPVSRGTQAPWQLPQRARAVHKDIVNRVGSQAARLHPVGWEQVGLARDQRLHNPHLQASERDGVAEPGRKAARQHVAGLDRVSVCPPDWSGTRLHTSSACEGGRAAVHETRAQRKASLWEERGRTLYIPTGALRSEMHVC